MKVLLFSILLLSTQGALQAKDSIHFNANPTIKGNVDTYGSITGHSKDSNNSGRIASFNSANRANNKALNRVKGEHKGNKRSSIYKYALMKGNKEVNLQAELEKMVNASMDSYNSEGSGGDSDSESDSGSGKNTPKSIQTPGGPKSKFARN